MAWSPVRGRWWLSGTFLILATLLGVFFFLFVPARTAQVSEENFRRLGDMAEHFRDSIANLSKSLAKASESADAQNTNLNAYFNQIEPRVTIITNRPMTNALEIDRSLDQYTLVFQLPPIKGRSGDSDAPTLSTAVATVDFAEFLRPVIRRHNFDDVLLVDYKNGEVLYQLSQTEQRATNLLALSDLIVTEIPDLSQKYKTSAVTQATAMLDLGLTPGAAFKLFSQPLHFSTKVSESHQIDTKWFLCGLIRAGNFRAQTWEISSTPAIGFIFTAVGMLLLWPILNLVFWGPRDDLKRSEVAAVVLASYFGCATLTFLIFHLQALAHRHQETHEKLDELSKAIQINLTNELRAVNEQLTHFNQEMIERGKIAQTNSDLNLTKLFEARSHINSNALLRPFSTNNYWWFSMGTWVGADGRQLYKWTIGSNNTPVIEVRDRLYFRSIVQNQGWPWFLNSGAPGPNTDSFYLESIFSRNRNVNAAVFSKPFPAYAWENSKTNVVVPAVSTLEFRPLSLFEPVLPPGYSFCVIDNKGRVLFDVDERRNLRENFLKETGHPKRLQAALVSRTVENFDARYHNTVHHVHIEPMRHFPEWSLAVFRDNDELGSLDRAALSSAAMLFATYSLGLLLLAALSTALILSVETVGRRRRHRLSAVFWPDIKIGSPPLWRSGYRAALAFTLGSFFLAAAPAACFYNYSARVEEEIFVNAAMVKLKDAIAEKESKIEARFNRWRQFTGSRSKTNAYALYDPLNWSKYYESAAFFQVRVNDITKTNVSSGLLRRYYSTFRAAFDRPGSSRSGFLQGVAADESWRFSPDDDGKYALAYRDYQTNPWKMTGSPEFLIRWPKIENPLWLLWYVLIVIVPITLWLLARLVARNVFLTPLSREIENRELTPGPVHLALKPPQDEWRICKYAENDPFAAAEKHHVKLLQKPGKGWEHIKPGEYPEDAILIPPEDIKTDELENLRRKLEEQGTRSVLFIARKDTEDLGKAWRVILSEVRLVTEEGYECEKPAAVAFHLHQWCAKAWERSLPKEQLALYQIAQNGFVHARKAELRDLLTKGLIRFTPELSITNGAFRRFILATVDPKRIPVAPGEIDVGFGWRSLRTPLAITVAVAALLLFFTQREIWQLGVTITSSLVAGLTEFSRFRDVLHKFRAGETR